ncbi:hypothetical protein N7481_010936 [Penicillium waksmanii]|uniref:uncharacterized protein n=1 Tax=Penicillium waksmanii TaxID=69791 RepID=UPI00254724D6|nr:uncharacterized protein N7481_010936 [Penicillium waksmanii]KAJ5973726.1 hypothetical protein N7481_010936 [Penicillium waksmanii]
MSDPRSSSTTTSTRLNAHSMSFDSTSPANSICSTDSTVDDEGFLESNYLASGPYLCTIPTHSIPLRDSQIDRDLWAELIVTSRRILQDCRITQEVQVEIIGRPSTTINIEPAPIPTILIIFDRHDTPCPPVSFWWRTAAKRIHNKYRSRIEGLSVELIDID